MHEEVDVKVARIEEGMVRLHAKIDANHQMLMKLLEPAVTKVGEHHADIRGLRRDRSWIIALLVVTLACAVRACLHFMA